MDQSRQILWTKSQKYFRVYIIMYENVVGEGANFLARDCSNALLVSNCAQQSDSVIRG